MLKETASADRRPLRTKRLECDLAVIGGGLSGVCAAVTAARAGIKVVLIQDRPVLGGNASSEVRLWVLGATSHLGNNNRWSREGGVTDEILVENMYRNPEGNAYVFDTVMLEKVVAEPNITLLLNTAVYDLEKSDPDTIRSVRAFCSQNSTQYEIFAPLFCDASGDGIVGFMAGAAFRMGAESRDEFGEKFAPTKEYGELLGHSIYFYSKDVGRPVKFTPPSYALKDITQIPRYKRFNTKEYGCRLWWIEYGGRLDTIHDTESIKWELWKVVYGVWNHIKNSGEFPEAANLTLEWVGTVPGKRESRRFEGDYMLIQQDIVEQRKHKDAVSFGGWSIDLHPADGVFSERPGCNQWHAKGVFQIPYRCMYSRNIRNLFLAGRIISASHVAFGSTRVMATCGHGAQAIGLAAALCRAKNLLPRDLSKGENLLALQRNLLRTGQYIPGVVLPDESDLAQQATVTASGHLTLSKLAADDGVQSLDHHWAMILPLKAGKVPTFTLLADVAEDTELRLELRTSSSPDNYTPDVTLATKSVPLSIGRNQTVRVDFKAEVDTDRYVFLCAMANEHVQVRCSEQRVTGIVSACNKGNLRVAAGAVQRPPEDIGVDTFEFWRPFRRPDGRNFAITVEPPLDCFSPENVTSGPARPTRQPNAWVADPVDPKPSLTLSWKFPKAIRRIELSLDPDWDHPMESVLMGHPENVMPFTLRDYTIRDASGNVLAQVADNHLARNVIVLDQPVTTRSITIEARHPSPLTPAAIFEVRCYAE